MPEKPVELNGVLDRVEYAPEDNEFVFHFTANGTVYALVLEAEVDVVKIETVVHKFYEEMNRD